MSNHSFPMSVGPFAKTLRRAWRDARIAVFMPLFLAASLFLIVGIAADGSLTEPITFCTWLRDGNFTLLGMQEHARNDNDGRLAPVPGTGLGILRDDLPMRAKGVAASPAAQRCRRR